MQEKSVSNLSKPPRGAADGEIMTHFVHPLVWQAPGLGGVRRHIWRAICALEVAFRVRCERRALADLDECALKDIGYTHSAAWAEAHRSLWDVPTERLRT